MVVTKNGRQTGRRSRTDRPHNGVEYRVVWKREGGRRHNHRFVRLATAHNFISLMTSDEPWLHIAEFADMDPADFVCCSGLECGCAGETIRAHFDARRERLDKIEYVYIESREVGPWRA